MYASGRTVKTSKPQQSPIAAATAAARRLARKHLAGQAIISSSRVAGLDGVVRIRTEILFTERPHEASKALADAVKKLAGYDSITWNLVSVTFYLRTA